jgi:hypothetical protein
MIAIDNAKRMIKRLYACQFLNLIIVFKISTVSKPFNSTLMSSGVKVIKNIIARYELQT